VAVTAGLCGPVRGADDVHASTQAMAGPLRVVAFYSSTCQDCYKAKKALAAVRERWGSRIRVEHRDMKDVKVFVQMFAYDEHYGAEAQAPPKVFVGEQYLEGYPAIARRLAAVVAKELDKETVTFDPKAGTGAATTGPATQGGAVRLL